MGTLVTGGATYATGGALPAGVAVATKMGMDEVTKPEPIEIENTQQAAVEIADSLFMYAFYGFIALYILDRIINPLLESRRARRLEEKIDKIKDV